MNAVEQGKASSLDFIGDVTIEHLTLTEYADIGYEAAHYHFRAQESIEAFTMGWLFIGLQISHVMRSEPLRSKESHVDTEKILAFRARR